MNKKARKFPLGEFLKELREKKGVSLMDVEKATGISNAYLSQLETGARKKLPEPNRLRKIANYYNVTVPELLQKAGYYESKEVEETYEQKIKKSFEHLITNPAFRSDAVIIPKDLPLDIKRFVIDMNSHYTQQSLIGKPYIEGVLYDEKDGVKRLKWKTEDVMRESFNVDKESFIRYRVKVTCIEIEGRASPKPYDDEPLKGSAKISQTSTAEGEFVVPMAKYLLGYESFLLVKATDDALIKALKKIKGSDWKSQFGHLWDK